MTNSDRRKIISLITDEIESMTEEIPEQAVALEMIRTSVLEDLLAKATRLRVEIEARAFTGEELRTDEDKNAITQAQMEASAFHPGD